VSSPPLDQVWYADDTQKVITWAAKSGTDKDGNAPKVKLEYNINGGSYNLITNAGNLDSAHGTNNFTWATGVADERSEIATVLVTHNAYTSVNLPSSNFKIRPLITVTTPTTGQLLEVGEDYASLIKWTATGTKTATVDVLYDTAGGGGGYTDPAIASAEAVGNGVAGLDWDNIPDQIGNNVRIKVVDTASATVFGESPIFEIIKH